MAQSLQELWLLPGSPVYSPLEPPSIPQLLNLWESRNEKEGPTSDSVFPFGITMKTKRTLGQHPGSAPSFTNKELKALRR